MYYPLGTLYPNQLPQILVELQEIYVGYLFLFDGQDKGYLEYLSYGFTPQIRLVFKNPNTLNDYLIVVSTLGINNPRNYEGGDSSGSSSDRFVEVFQLLEYLSKVTSDEETDIDTPIAYFDKAVLGEKYKNNSYDLDIEDLSKTLNRHLLNQLPTYLLNPSWKRERLLFESAKQVREIMSAETNMHDIFGHGCYGLPKNMYTQMFTVWETGETKPLNLNFLEMARKLRIFLDRVNRSENNQHLQGLDNVYSALYYCTHSEKTMEPALIISDAHDEFRIEIIPSGWDNDSYVQRLPGTTHYDYNGIAHDGSAFKLFKY